MQTEGFGKTNCDSRDCGAFFLDAVGYFTRQDVIAKWSAQPRPTTDEVEAIIDRCWQEQLRLADRDGRLLFDGELCRLVDFEAGPQLVLTVGPTSYRQFVGTNLFHAKLLYTHGPEVLANPVGVSAAMVSADGFLVLARRSKAVAFHAGRIHPLGGMLEGAGGSPDPFASMLDELAEETSLDPSAVRNIACIGMVRDKQIVQPELVFELVVEASFNEIVAGYEKSADCAEHTRLLPVSDRPASVVDFIRRHPRTLTPVAKAALLLHGLRRWGSGWLATARGYLRNVI